MRRSVPAALLISVIFASALLPPRTAWGLVAANVPLDSPIYVYLEKLSGFGLIDTDIHGLKPYTKAEAARLILEAEGNMGRLGTEDAGLAGEMIRRVRELIPREVDLYNHEEDAPLFDMNPISSARIRYVHLDGVPRNFTRRVSFNGGDSFFGFGHVEPRQEGVTGQEYGTEGTPLVENNEGINYRRGNNVEIRTDAEFFFTSYCAALVEPVTSVSGIGTDNSSAGVRLNKGYLKLGGGGLELEAGRDANWFGQGFRGATVLTNNARNMDLVKLSSPEPVDWPWFRRNIGLLKYAFVVSRLSESGEGQDLRRPWFAAAKLSIKPSPDFEVGFNYARQQGGPGVESPGFFGSVFSVGSAGNGSNSLAGFELRWRLPWFMGTTVYGEYCGEDNLSVLPVVGSYLAGVYVPRLTPGGRDDLRFEFYTGNRIAYTDYKFPEGYTNGGMTMGHSQGGDTKEYFARYSHFFTERSRVALEYFHTQRGRMGRLGDEQVEEKDAGRIFWYMPLSAGWDLLTTYGYENIRNADLVGGARRDNHVFRLDLSYRY